MEQQEEKKENLIAVLLVEEGKKPGQPIATYSLGRRDNYLVFMPSNAPVGQQARVKLIETGKYDSRGQMLYRAIPASVEYSESWRDNGDGTISLVLFSINWLLQKSVEGERERRFLEKDVARNEEAKTRTEYSIDWGSDFSLSTVTETEIKETPICEEYIEDGEIHWREANKQETRNDLDIYQITRAGGIEQSLSKSNLLLPNWDPNWQIKLEIYFIKNGQEENISYQTEWGKLSGFVQQQLQVKWPLCSCGRERIALAQDQKTDDYPKCNKCRSEETCERCGEHKKINYLDGHLVCDDCVPYESAEQLINKSITMENKKVLAELVKKMLAAQPLEAELGIMILKNNLSHVPDVWTQNNILNQWKYPWYYLTEDGFFGSKFSPTALSVLRYLPQANGNGLVEMIAWLTGGFQDGNDFYTLTQVKGQKKSLPTSYFSNVIAMIASENYSRLIVEKLCGSDSDRQLVLKGQKVLEAHASEHEKIRSCLQEVNRILYSNDQDYQKALKIISEADNLIQNLQRLEDLLEAEYKTCPICGTELEHNCTHYCGSDYDDEFEFMESGDVIKSSCIDGEEIVSLTFEDGEIYFKVDTWTLLNNMGVKKINTENIHTKKIRNRGSYSQEELSVLAQMNGIKKKLAAIEREQDLSNRVMVDFSEGLDPQGRKQLCADAVFSGSIENKKSVDGYSNYDNQPVIFICNANSQNWSWLEELPQTKQTWSCKPAFQISLKNGKPVIVVNPQLRIDQEKNLREELKKLQKEENKLTPEASTDQIEALKAAWGSR